MLAESGADSEDRLACDDFREGGIADIFSCERTIGAGWQLFGHILRLPRCDDRLNGIGRGHGHQSRASLQRAGSCQHCGT